MYQVSSEDEAIALMNDSPYGLTASIWTNVQSNPESERLFEKFVEELETGTVFLNRCVNLPYSSYLSLYNPWYCPACCSSFVDFPKNQTTEPEKLSRCDYLDPALAWTGVKDSGRGVSLSKFGMSPFILFLSTSTFWHPCSCLNSHGFRL